MKKWIVLIGLVFISTTMVCAQTKNTAAQPPDGYNALSAYSLFLENYRNDQYNMALKYGRWILKGMPKTIKGYGGFSLSDNLDRLIDTYAGLAKKTTDPSLKAAYVDTANMIYDKVFSNFSKDEIDFYQWHLNRGRFYQDHKDFIENAKGKATEEYKKAFELNPKKMASTDQGYYIQVMLQNLVSDHTDATKQEALSVIKQAVPYANDTLNNYFDKVRNQLFDSPEERIAFLQKKVNDNPKDQEAMQKLRDLYDRQGDTKKVQELNKKLYDIDPNYQNTVALANFATKNANYSDAIKYLKKALEKTDDSEKVKIIDSNLAEAYTNTNKLSKARTYARKAIDADPKWGRPYIQLASIYAQAVNNCTKGRDLKLEDRVVYWLIIDELQKAKRVDPSVASTANQQIQSYKAAAPTSENIFFKNWKEGQRVKVDGSLGSCYAWIGQTTTVRKF